MSRRTDLEHEFRSRGVYRGGEHYLIRSDAFEFVKRASQAGVAIIGVEAFLLSETETKPLPSSIGDSSGTPGGDWNEFVGNVNREAIHLLQTQVRDDHWIVLVTASEEDVRLAGG